MPKFETEYVFEKWRNSASFAIYGTEFGNGYEDLINNTLNGSGWDYSIKNNPSFSHYDLLIFDLILNNWNQGVLFTHVVEGNLWQYAFSVYPFILLSESLNDEWLQIAKQNEAGYSQVFSQVNKYSFQIQGDPALNILADGYQITQDVTVPCDAVITTRIEVRNGATLTVPNNCNLIFYRDGQLIIENDGNLVIGSGATITADASGVKNSITITGGLTVGSGVTFENIKGGITLNKKSLQFNDNKTFSLSGVTFINTTLYHYASKLNLQNCNFGTGCDVKTNMSKVTLNNCTFNNSTFLSNQKGFSSSNPLDKPFTSVINSNFTGLGSNTAIYVKYSDEFSVNNNIIEGYETGIFIENNINFIKMASKFIFYKNGFSEWTQDLKIL